MNNNNININNYEIYFIDYLDGKLTPFEQKELILFLNHNPHLSNELNQISELKLIPDNYIYTSKNNLKKESFKKSELSSKVELLIISELEGDLSENEVQELERLKSEDYEVATAAKNIIKTKLTPNPNEVFGGKSRLKRIVIFGISHYTLSVFSRIAASIIVLLGVGFALNTYLVNSKGEEFVTNNHINTNLNTLKETEINSESVVNVSPQTQAKEIKSKLITRSTEQENVFNDEGLREEVALQYINRREPTITSAKIAVVPLNKSVLLGIDHFLNSNGAPSQQVAEIISIPWTKEFGFFELAQLGVKKLSDMTGTRARLEGERDETGKLTRVNFETSLFAISTPVTKK
jgi:hypothetical protein